ncbi:hypothetical protein G9A89_022331 [Geosiphon pyriformis]|nr:hypothetical protein G9A89_022331 [Geosiphon pyriformis]
MSEEKTGKKRKKSHPKKFKVAAQDSVSIPNLNNGNNLEAIKTVTSSSSLQVKDGHSTNPYLFGRKYTVSVALPGSIIDNAQSNELKTYLAGQLARSFAIFNVDEVVIFNEARWKDNAVASGGANKEGKRGEDKHISSDPNVFLARILQYLETPQYLRKALFPMHKDLQYAGLLNPLDCSHHFRQEEKTPYREGVVISKVPKGGKGSLVDAGLNKNVIIDRSLKPGIRVTLQIDNFDTINEGKLSNYIQAKVISPKTPREQCGLYWGYQIRLANSISKVFTECPYTDGYDVSIGTSERGQPIDLVIEEIPEFRHLLIVFGGLGGLELAIDADEDLKCGGDEADALFDLWVNTCPHQGSRTIRTEEAILISMSSLQSAIKKKGKND